MKKTLLTGIAALFLATGAAHAIDYDKYPDGDLYEGAGTAHATSTLMPVEVRGDWCLFQGEYPNPMYFRTWTTDDDCVDKLTINPDGYETYAVSCTFSNIKVRKERYLYTYTVRTTCERHHGNIVKYKQDMEFQPMKGKLYIRAYHRVILEKAP
jgi:hypothetical protein